MIKEYSSIMKNDVWEVVPRQRYIEVSRDVIFHEEVVFRQSKELPKDTEESPSEILDSPHSEVQREEEENEPQILNAPLESERPAEELLEALPSKRRLAWFRETLQEAEKHKAPPGTFRESIKP